MGRAWYSTGNLLLTGDFVGTVDFGSGPIASDGRDIFCAKLAP